MRAICSQSSVFLYMNHQRQYWTGRIALNWASSAFISMWSSDSILFWLFFFPYPTPSPIILRTCPLSLLFISMLSFNSPSFHRLQRTMEHMALYRDLRTCFSLLRWQMTYPQAITRRQRSWYPGTCLPKLRHSLSQEKDSLACSEATIGTAVDP